MELRNLIIGGLLVGLFVFSMVNFSIYMTADNEVNNTLMEYEAFNQSFGEFQTELSNSQAEAEAQKQVQSEDNPTGNIQELPLTTTPKITDAFYGMWRNMYNLTFGLIQRVLGIPPVVMKIFTSILLISVILLIWGLIKAGR